MQIIERQGLGRPQISPLAQDQNTHRRLTLMSQALDETLAASMGPCKPMRLQPFTEKAVLTRE